MSNHNEFGADAVDRESDPTRKILREMRSEFRAEAERLKKAEKTIFNGEPAKTCTKCGRNLPLRAYHKRQRSRDGHRARCKDCSRADYRERYADDDEFKSRRIDYIKKMYLRRHRPDDYMVYLRLWRSRNAEAAERGEGPRYTFTGQIARDLEVFTATGKIDLGNERKTA